VSLIEPAQLLHAEVHVPAAVVHRLQAHVLAHQHTGHVDVLLAPPDAARRADLPDLESVGVLHRQQPGRHGSAGRNVDLHGLAHVQALVRAQLAVVRNKAIYLALGVLPDGTRDVLGLWIENTEGAKFCDVASSTT